VTDELRDALAADDDGMAELLARLDADAKALEAELFPRLAADDAAMAELFERLAAEPDPCGPEFLAALEADSGGVASKFLTVPISSPLPNQTTDLSRGQGAVRFGFVFQASLGSLTTYVLETLSQMFCLRLSQNGMKSKTPRVKTIANPATKPATRPRIQNILENPAGLRDAASITRNFMSRLAGVWPVPTVIAAQISQPIPKVMIPKITSTK
jgi:hypothetical protein